MQTGENEQALRKILDMTRLISMVLLCLHIYFYCYTAFREWHLTMPLTDRLIGNVTHTGLFKHQWLSKLWTLLLLFVSLLGVRGRKSEKMNYKTGIAYALTGLLLYFISVLFFYAPWSAVTITILYIAVTVPGYLLIMTGGTLLTRVIRDKLKDDIFNRDQETFPQEERLLENEYSINLPAKYKFKGKVRNSWISIVNPFRSVLVAGSPGAGKSWYVIRHVLTQHIRKGFTMFVYDFKYPDLSVIAYNAWLNNKASYTKVPEFFVINFDDLTHSHRCNPLDPSSMLDITDATESARTILLGLNKVWQTKTGDFFVESPINFVTAIIWFLRKFMNGEYCTLPHVIEFMQLDYDSLFTILRTENEIDVLIGAFVNAYENDVMEQLEGQIASAKVAMARLSSPQLYYVLSGSDFKLDLNNPDAPKIICMGNNPQKVQVYGAVLSLYVNRLVKLVNQKGKLKSSLIFDEFPTIYLNNIDGLIATARSNKVATCLGIQDFSQLRKDYGREQSDVIVNIVGNIISGQVNSDTAKQLSERIGKIMQDRESLSINANDTSISKSKQLEAAVPPSKISSLSAGEFVGLVADNPDQRIELKAFHCEIQNDVAAMKKEEDAYQEIPIVRQLTPVMVQRNYNEIKQDIQDIKNMVYEKLLNDPAQQHLIIRKGKS